MRKIELPARDGYAAAVLTETGDGIVYQFVTKGTVERKSVVGRLEIPVAGSLKDNVIAGLSSGIE